MSQPRFVRVVSLRGTSATISGKPALGFGLHGVIGSYFLPRGGRVDIPLTDLDGNTLLVSQLNRFVSAGAALLFDEGGNELSSVSDAFLLPPPVVSNATRPAATSVPTGYQVFNVDDKAPNYSDGTLWFDAAGSLT